MGCIYGEGMYVPGGGGAIPGIIGYERSQNTGDVIIIPCTISYLTRIVLRVSVNVAARLCRLLSRILLVRGWGDRRGDGRGEVWRMLLSCWGLYRQIVRVALPVVRPDRR